MIDPSTLVLCLASMAFYEARGESIKGATHVMEVAIHRAKVNYRGAKDVCEVVKSDKQFSAFNRGYKEPDFGYDDYQKFADLLVPAWRVYRGAIDNLPDSVMHYHTTQVSPWWSKGVDIYEQEGMHVFFAGIK